MAVLYVIDLVNIQPRIIASLREFPRVFNIISRGLEPASNNSSQVVRSVVPARSNDVLSSSLIAGMGHPVGFQPCELTGMRHVPTTSTQHVMVEMPLLSFTASASWEAVECWRQGAAEGALEAGFGNPLLVLWFTCLYEIRKVRNTYLM